MMRRYAILILAVLNMGLATVLIAFWVDVSGKLRNITWQAPAPHAVELGEAPAGLTRNDTDMGRYLATLDRPLFSPSRRPAPAKADASTAQQVDALAGVQLSGVFGGGQFGGLIAKIEGKNKRVMLGEQIGDWTLKAVKGAEATLSRVDETRVLRVERPKTAAAADTASTASAQNSPPAAPNTVIDQQQRIQEETRATLQRRNALRAKAGLPPVKE